MKKLIVLLLVPFFLLAGCGNESGNATQSDAEGKINIVTTIAQIGDIAKNVGGEHVQVESLMGPGVDPHVYEAVPSDIDKLENADLIYYNGLNLEGQMNQIFEKMQEEKPTYAVAETIPQEKLTADPENPEVADPHVWFDIQLWQYAVEEVTNALIELDPDNKADYEKNREAYSKELDELHEYALQNAEEVPEKSRVMVTAHDAFQYFGDAYGFEVMGLQGLSTDSEFGLKDVQRIVDTLVERDIKAVFVESSVSDEAINAVVEGAKDKGHEVEIGGEIYSDAMGPEGTEEGTYVGMFTHNIDTIVNSLK
ncbi:metal ABC transporter solute-binding protein, Zn/Mn family [Pontibacillus litoralis]|uniref:Manganese transporter n=1 Tax=Pontibacillus litoralis JSM 072002 TaxID=1385512 RepID=A0A0A5G2J4_9BACI|nr:zinc ABC transporter substrate-binding protein [Pontibacillus litoralis]KGX87316.1 manganese transporter [Pontibacillus litoralis JSM 072002]